MTARDRAEGCLLGLSLGDALGAPFEFRRAAEIPATWPALELEGVFGPPGATTDDTALARNLARSLAERGGLDAGNLAARHVAWFRSDPPDVGRLTSGVLGRIARGEGPEDAARAEWERRGPERAGSNGSVMYCAPLGVALAAADPQHLLDEADRLSGLTHHDDRCRAACQVVTLAVAELIRGAGREQAVRTALERVHGWGRADEAEEIAFMLGEAGINRAVDGPDQGYVAYTTAVGLRALRDGEDFEPALRAVVRLGGDTDTNAAVAGALVGTAVGRAGLPREWLGRLRERAAIESESVALARLAQRSGPTASST